MIAVDQRQAIWFAFVDDDGKSRDGEAGQKGFAALGPRYRLGETIYNTPDFGDRLSLTGTHLLYATTRLPLDDQSDRNRRQVETSGNELEQTLFQFARTCFKHLSRTKVVLSDPFEEYLSCKGRDEAAFYRYDIEFEEYVCPCYRKCRGPHGARFRPPREFRLNYRHITLTAGYLIYTPRLWRDGPSFLAVFGMAYDATRVWVSLLQTIYQPLLQSIVSQSQRRFVMAEWPVAHHSRKVYGFTPADARILINVAW